jgi:hypothetical protein
MMKRGFSRYNLWESCDKQLCSESRRSVQLPVVVRSFLCYRIHKVARRVDALRQEFLELRVAELSTLNEIEIVDTRGWNKSDL